jgi:hypothetical protein
LCILEETRDIKRVTNDRGKERKTRDEVSGRKREGVTAIATNLTFELSLISGYT